MDEHTLYLVDGTSICYRSFYAIKLSTSDGFPTGAIYGFFTTLKKIMKKFNPYYMGICFDVSRKTHRLEKYREYKIQRPPTPDKLKIQLPIIKELVISLGIKLIEKEGFEADDLIASLTEKAEEKGFRVVIVSSDKDIFQLVRDKKVVVYDPTKDVMYDEDRFVAEFGFVPSRIVDYLSLVGDSVDNIPGAKGIGKVGATNLLKNFGSLEGIFDNLDKVPEKVKNALLRSKNTVLLSKELVQLYPVPLDIEWESLRVKEPDYSKLYKIFKDLEFRSLLKEISLPSFNLDVEVVDNFPHEVKEKIIKDRKCIFYYAHEQFYVWGGEKIYTGKIRDVRDILEDERIKKISYDFKLFFKNFKEKIKLEGELFDVMIASYVVNSSLVDYSLNNLVAFFLEIFTREIPLEVYPYFINKLYQLLEERLYEYKLYELFSKIEMPLVEVLALMEKEGIRVDRDFLKNFFREISQKLAEIEENIFKIVGKKFNLNSSHQLSKILFEELKLSPIKKGKTCFSTSEDVLVKLRDKHPIIDLVLKYRQLSKLRSTYLEPFLKEVEIGKGKVFAKFNQTGTQTGRLSSSSPNIQNIPIRTEEAKKIRKAFISSFNDGFILCADYSQIELRILAHLSGDENLIDAFSEDLDVHKITASLLFGIPEERVTEEQRDIAKKINFGIIYGMGAARLAKELNISYQEAETFIRNYFSRYPKVKEYINRVVEEAKNKGYVRTIFGRVRFIDRKKGDPSLFMRQAINTPIQGSASDIIKLAMISIHKKLQEKSFKSKMIMQIHDELVFDVEKKELEELKLIVKKSMEEIVSLKVPLKVNLKVGKNWLDLEDI